MENKTQTLTKGNVVVENIKVGDIHYEYEMGLGIKCQVETKPTRDAGGHWKWTSKNCKTGNIINYMVTEGMSHYSANLYDHEAYKVKHYI